MKGKNRAKNKAVRDADYSLNIAKNGYVITHLKLKLIVSFVNVNKVARKSEKNVKMNS